MLNKETSSLPLSLKLESVAMGIGVGLVVVAGMLSVKLVEAYNHKFFPGIVVDGQDLGGLSYQEALDTIGQPELPKNDVITLKIGEISVASTSGELGVHQDLEPTLLEAYNVGREGNFTDKLLTLIKLSFKPQVFGSKPAFNQGYVAGAVKLLKEKADIPGIEPAAELVYSGSPSSLKIEAGKIGQEVPLEEAVKLVLAKAGQGNVVVEVPQVATASELTPEQVAAAYERAKKLVGKSIKLSAEEKRVNVNDQQMISWLSFPDGISRDKASDEVNAWANGINREPQDAEFSFDAETLKVTAFKPHRNGLIFSPSETIEPLSEAIKTLETSDEVKKEVPLSVFSYAPAKTLESTNTLGIKEEIGFGDSSYGHSIPNRIHNVSVTTERINNTLVAPGAEFSFNNTLGEVSAATGFRAAYVIKGGRTELGDGGGVCQVSSTLFRVLLDSGLPITKRRPHSYRVGYYEQNSEPGFDATVYSGDIDLRFVNDTGHYILIHAEADPKTQYMKVELYGTSDGRTTEISNYQKWDFRGPLPTEYYPDASLRPGQLVQIDWSASGLKTKFTHTVRDKNGEIIRQNDYASDYRPWAAKYLRGI